MPKNAQQKKAHVNNRLSEVKAYTPDPQVPPESGPHSSEVDREAVQFRAYLIYEVKGGDALDNWLEAERQLRQESQR